MVDNLEKVPSRKVSALTNHTHRDEHHDIGHSGSTILFIFVSCLFGAVIRSLLKDTNLPFTVFIFILGCALGILSVLIDSVSAFTLLATLDPHLMLHIFLPVLVFDSAYALELHTLIKSFSQVVILAVPGFMLNAFLSGVLVRYVFPYNWPWSVSMAFGTTISATDPLAVVSTLKELGTDKKLAILLEGESLLNDGAALVFFTIFLQMARGDYESSSETGAVVTLFFIRVLFGGTLLGYVMGKICSAWLAKIFNDAVIETLITIAFPYITYFIAEAVFGVSGVLAVVVLGAVLSSEKTSVSPEVERFLHSQWSLLAFVSNTLIFILVGIVITELGIREISNNQSYSHKDWFYIFVLYLGIIVIRGITLLVFSPVLRCFGYGFDWSKGIVMWWGALRGAVSLALALLVAEDDSLDPNEIGNKFLMYAAGIVVLTLVINGSTMRFLLGVLGLTKISMAKKMAMAAAVKALEETQKAMIADLKSDRFLADAHWDVVMMMSEIKNPYADRIAKESTVKSPAEEEGTEHNSHGHNKVVCPDCSSLIHADLTANQYKEYEEEARIRYLKAQKVSYWRQFEHGLLGRTAVRKLIELTESIADKTGAFISIDDITASWKMRGIYRLFPKLSYYLTKLCNVLMPDPIADVTNNSLTFTVATSKSLWITVVIILLLQGIVGVVQLLTYFHEGSYHIIYFVFSLNFAIFFFGESIIKIVGLGYKQYFKSFWNVVAFILVMGAYPELYACFEAARLYEMDDVEEARDYHLMAGIIQITRCLRLLETLIKTCFPAILKAVDRRIESQINFGYDVGRGFVVGEEECRQLLDHIVEHAGMRDKFKNRCDKIRLAVIKELALLQRSTPGVAVAVKTRQATRTVLNKIRDTLDKLKEDGLIDEIEADRLHRNTDKLIKMLVSAPPSVPPLPAENMLSFVPWLQGGGNSIAKFMKERAQLINFDHNDEILHSGEAPKGIYIVVSGLVKKFGKQRLHSHYTMDAGEETQAASADRYTDYLGAGAVLGEMGPLMDSHVTTSVTAETAVQLYFLNITDLEIAFDMYPEVRLKLWKNCAIKIVLNLLTEHKDFQNIPTESARAYLEHGYIPHLNAQTVYNLDDNIEYAFLVHGRVKVYARPDLELLGPAFIPNRIRVLQFNDPQETILYLVPGEENPLAPVDSFHEGIKNKLKSFASAMGRKLLLNENLKKPVQQKKATFFDIINMIRIKKLLNKKATVANLASVENVGQEVGQRETMQITKDLSVIPALSAPSVPHAVETSPESESNQVDPGITASVNIQSELTKHSSSKPKTKHRTPQVKSAPILQESKSEVHRSASQDPKKAVRSERGLTVRRPKTKRTPSVKSTIADPQSESSQPSIGNSPNPVTPQIPLVVTVSDADQPDLDPVNVTEFKTITSPVDLGIPAPPVQRRVASRERIYIQNSNYEINNTSWRRLSEPYQNVVGISPQGLLSSSSEPMPHIDIEVTPPSDATLIMNNNDRSSASNRSRSVSRSASNNSQASNNSRQPSTPKPRKPSFTDKFKFW